MEGKYKITHKKVVSNFRKERMLQIDFLNSPENCQLPARRPRSFFFVRLGTSPYEILMNRSGLSEGHFAMLISGVEGRSVGRIHQTAESNTSGRFVPAGHDRHRLSSGWFPCMRVLSFRLISMDAGHEAQSHKSGRCDRGYQREQTATSRWFPEDR